LNADAGGTNTESGAEPNARLDAVVGINAADVFRAAVFVDAGVVIRWRAVDAFTLHGRGVDVWLRRSLESCPRHRDRFAGRRGAGAARASRTAAAGSSDIAGVTAGFQDGVSHAAGFPVEDDVFDDADFGSVSAADFRADDLAALDVAG